MSPVRLILVLGAISAVAPLAIDMYLPVFPVIAGELDASVASVQLSLSAFFVGLAAGQLLWGPLADRFGRKPPLVCGLALFVAASAGCALAPDIGSLVTLRVLQALGGCAGMVIPLAVVRDLFDAQDGARLMSRLWLVFGAAPILAPSLGAWIVGLAGWRVIFWILAAYGVACLVLVLRWLPESRRARSDDIDRQPAGLLRDFAALLRDRRFLGFTGAVAFCHASLLAYVTASPQLLITHYRVTPAAFALLFAANAVGLVLSAQLNAHLLRRHPPQRLLQWAGMAAPLLGLVLLALVSGRTGGVPALMVTLCAYLATTAFIRPNATACALAGQGERAGTAASLIGALQFLLATVAGLLISTLDDGTGRPMALVITALAVAALASYRLLARVPPGRGAAGA